MEKLKINYSVNTSNDVQIAMEEAYAKCPAAIKYCREIGMSEQDVKDNITKVYDFVSDINYCKNCPGVDKCQKNNPLLVTKILYRNGRVDAHISPCPQLLKRVSFERQFIVADFEQDWLNTTLKDIDFSKERALALQKYTNFVKTGKTNWIYLSGGPGTGRSYLAAALVIDAARRNLGPICYINCSKRISELKDLQYKKSDEFNSILEKYSNVPILVMDDFGNEFKNDFIRDAVVFQILSTRMSKKLFTIITSDFSVEEIETLYTTSKAGEIRAKQIGRIIRGACEKEINLGDLSIY